MLASDEIDLLLRALSERESPLERDDVAGAFKNEKTEKETRSWVREHLTPVSLLTREELVFREKRPTSSSRGQIKSAVGRPITDSELKLAIASLETSTAAIEKQCQMLEHQKRAIQDLKSRAGDTNLEQAQIQRQKRLTRERAQLEFETNELTGSIQSRLQASSKQIDVAVAGLPSGIDRLLEKDDRILDRVQKLLPKLIDRSPDGAAELIVEKLCLVLITLSAQEIRYQIDAAYRSSASTNGPASTGESQKRIDSLHAELAELAGEIDGLAVMAVDGQYRTPIARALKISRSEAEAERVKWTDYVLATFQYLVARLDSLSDHTQHLHAHQSALKHLTATLDALTASLAATAAKQEIQASPISPATPSQTRGLRTLRLVQANLSETQDPAAALSRHLDIKVADPTKLLEILEQTLCDRQSQLGDLSRSTVTVMSDQVAESLNKADGNVQDLLAAVFAQTKYATVKVVDGEVQDTFNKLEVTTQTVGREMRNLDMDATMDAIRQKQQAIKDVM